MHRIIFLLLTALLLTGCAPAKRSATEGTDLAPTEMAGSLFAPIFLEIAPGLQRISLGSQGAAGPYSFGTDLLFLRHDGSCTELTVFSPEKAQVLRRTTLPLTVSPEAGDLQIIQNTIGYYDSTHKSFILLDKELRQTAAVSLPQDFASIPRLSQSQTTLYYSTADAVRALDLNTGLSKPLKEGLGGTSTIRGTHCNDQVLHVRAPSGQQLFLSTQTGQLLRTLEGEMELVSRGSRYYMSTADGFPVFGTDPDTPMMLLPSDRSLPCTFLPECHGAVTVAASAQEEVLDLTFYDLETGRKTGSVSIPSRIYWSGLTADAQGIVYVLLYDPSLGEDVLYRWDPDQTPVKDPTGYTAAYYPAEAPDRTGLAQCQERADSIGEAYGIQILLWEDALQYQPPDTTLEPEHLVSLLQQGLDQIEQALRQFPPGFLSTLEGCCDGIQILLVRSIRSGSGEVPSAHFWKGNRFCIAITPDPGNEAAIYHGLCHVMDTQILNQTGYYDSWEKLNPRGFQYSYSPSTTPDDTYLQGSNPAFLTRDSMTYPNEDRARILEYAMAPGNKDLFDTSYLQRKLRCMCNAIREAFDLQDHPEPLPWEQYLQVPIVK